jgi:hypothetical protein
MSPAPKPLQIYRFAGVSLGGGKTDKTAVAILEYYPEQRRIFLRTLRDKIKGDPEISADARLHELFTEEEPNIHSIAFDVPLQVPKCLRCPLKCPGYEKCKEPEIKWLWQVHRKKMAKKKPVKLFTPYTERCAEAYISTELEEVFHAQHALGANNAPLTARAFFIRRRLGKKVSAVEVFPKLSLWRIGIDLKVPKTHLRGHKLSMGGDEARLSILKALVEKEICFIYQQDMKMMVDNSGAFDAFICALTAFLKFRGQCEKIPAGFPKQEPWIDFPLKSITWF